MRHGLRVALALAAVANGVPARAQDSFIMQELDRRQELLLRRMQEQRAQERRGDDRASDLRAQQRREDERREDARREQMREDWRREQERRR